LNYDTTIEFFDEIDPTVSFQDYDRDKRIQFYILDIETSKNKSKSLGIYVKKERYKKTILETIDQIY
jgi:hypothetical protein